jgi:hypothetical protein
MAGSFPRIRLYESDGVTLVYEFDNVVEINDNRDPARFIEHKNFRGHGSVIVPGSDDSWDLPLTFILLGTDYEDLTSKIDTVKSSVEKFTKYILKIDKTTGGSTQDYKVMRLESFEFPVPTTGLKRVTSQRVNCIFKVLTWV